MVLASVSLSSIAFARITQNTIDPVAIVNKDGRQIIATGPFACTAGERYHLRLTVTQRATGAVADGRTFATCTGEPHQWEVDATSQGKERFEEGPATAVAVGRTTDRGETTDAHQWLVSITLVGE